MANVNPNTAVPLLKRLILPNITALKVDFLRRKNR